MHCSILFPIKFKYSYHVANKTSVALELCDVMMLFKTSKPEDGPDDGRAEEIRPGGRPAFPGARRPEYGGRPGPARAGSHREGHTRGKIEEDEDDKEEKKETDIKTSMILLARDVGIAFLILIIFIGSIWAYTGNWPPVVVVQSGSMMHGDDSEIGIIDTGDLVLVKKVETKSDITTYFEGKEKGYKTYGEYGDVIIYKKNGQDPDVSTPVIHRVLLWLEFNANATKADPDPNAGHFDIPELDKFDVTGDFVADPDFPAHASNDNDGPLILHLNQIYREMRADPHSGFITKGDNNLVNNIDQYSTSTPIKVDWIIGKAKGEMPWFGLIKLYASGSLEGQAPPTSVNMLILTLAVIIIVPISLEMAYTMYMNRKKAREDEEDEEEEEPEDRGRPGGRGPRSAHPPPLSQRGGRAPPGRLR